MADSGVHRVSGRLEVPRSLPALSSPSQAPNSKLLAGSSLQLGRDRVHEAFADTGIEGIVDFADAGRAGDVDLGEVIADDIRPTNSRPRSRSCGPTIAAISRSRSDSGCATPRRRRPLPRVSPAAESAPAVGDRLAIDHQDALVAILDRRNVALRHDLPAAMLGQHFEDHGQVGVALAMTEDRGASHFVQGFENDVTVLVGKLAENVGASADQGRRCALRELSGEELRCSRAGSADG